MTDWDYYEELAAREGEWWYPEEIAAEDGDPEALLGAYNAGADLPAGALEILRAHGLTDDEEEVEEEW